MYTRPYVCVYALCCARSLHPISVLCVSSSRRGPAGCVRAYKQTLPSGVRLYRRRRNGGGEHFWFYQELKIIMIIIKIMEKKTVGAVLTKTVFRNRPGGAYTCTMRLLWTITYIIYVRAYCHGVHGILHVSRLFAEKTVGDFWRHEFTWCRRCCGPWRLWDLILEENHNNVNVYFFKIIVGIYIHDGRYSIYKNP